MNQHRSKTAEDLFKDKHNVDSAGILNNYITKKQLEWADVVFVMESWHRRTIEREFPKLYNMNRIINLSIPDTYSYNDPELRTILKKKINAYL